MKKRLPILSGVDARDPLVCYRAGITLKAAALVFLDTVPEDIDPIVYAPGLEIRLTRIDTTGLYRR